MVSLFLLFRPRRLKKLTVPCEARSRTSCERVVSLDKKLSISRSDSASSCDSTFNCPIDSERSPSFPPFPFRCCLSVPSVVVAARRLDAAGREAASVGTAAYWFPFTRRVAAAESDLGGGGEVEIVRFDGPREAEAGRRPSEEAARRRDSPFQIEEWIDENSKSVISRSGTGGLRQQRDEM